MSLVSVDYQITNASSPFDFSVKDQNGVERFVSATGNKIYFNSISAGIHTIKITKNNCVISNEVITTDCSITPTPSSGCLKPILSVLSIENDKRASFSITNVSDCLSMELQYSTDINFLSYVPVYIGCVANQVITFPDNAIYHVRIVKTCINNLVQYSNAVSVNTIVGSSNCYVFAGCLHIGTNPSFDTYRVTLKYTTTTDVNFTLSNGTIIRILAGSYYGQEVINVTQGCPTVISNDLNLPYCNITPVTPTPTSCTGISNLNIVGINSVIANSSHQFSLSYTGNQPLTYSWNISGQGTSIISGQNSNTLTAKFGSSGTFNLYLDTTDECGNTVSATKEISLSTQPACDIIISSINIVCNGSSNSTVTVSASSASGKTLRYGILGFVNYQTSNVFNLPNSDLNGYTFQVVELGNESLCRVGQNRIVSCLPTPVTPTPTSCNLSISSVNVVCNSVNNATLTVNAINPNGYILQYQIDNYITWQDSNVFTGITNSGTGYIVSVRNKNNIACSAFKNNVFVDCQNTPVSCVGLTNLTVLGNSSVFSNTTNSYSSSYTGTAPTSYLWSISGSGASVIGANNASFVNFQTGIADGSITLQATNCNGMVTTNFPFSVINTATCISNVNFTVTFDALHLTDTTSIVYRKCGEVSNTVIGNGSFEMAHNDTYILTDCCEIGSISPFSGNATVTINSNTTC